MARGIIDLWGLEILFANDVRWAMMANIDIQQKC